MHVRADARPVGTRAGLRDTDTAAQSSPIVSEEPRSAWFIRGAASSGPWSCDVGIPLGDRDTAVAERAPFRRRTAAARDVPSL